MKSFTKLFSFVVLSCFLLVSMSAYAQPANDNLCDAIALTVNPSGMPGDCGGAFPYDNTGATTEAGEPIPACYGDNPAAIENTVWFSFTAGPGANTAITTDFAGSGNVDTQIAVYELPGGDCTNLGDLAEVFCQEDGGTAIPYNNDIFIPTITGTTYYVMIDGWQGTQGNFCLDVTDAVQDVCGDGVCTGAETWTSCPGDCDCVAYLDYLNYVDSTDQWFLSQTANAYCATDLDPGNVNPSPAVYYIPFVIQTEAPVDAYNVFVGSQMSTTIGEFAESFTQPNPVGSPVEGTAFIWHLSLTSADVAMGNPVVTFTDVTGDCTFSFTIDIATEFPNGLDADVDCAPPPPIFCADSDMTGGVLTTDTTSYCGAQLMDIVVTGVTNVPNQNGCGGHTVLVSGADISGSADPTNDPSYFGSFTPTTGPFGSVLGFNAFGALGAGTWCFTPMMYGEVADPYATGCNFFDLDITTGCVYTGTSVCVDVYADWAAECGGGGCSSGDLMPITQDYPDGGSITLDPMGYILPPGGAYEWVFLCSTDTISIEFSPSLIPYTGDLNAALVGQGSDPLPYGCCQVIGFTLDSSGGPCDNGTPTIMQLDVNDGTMTFCTPIVSGCTDPAACNYDPAATTDDGSCAVNDCEGNCGGAAVAGTACDDGDAYTDNDVYQADCTCMGIAVVAGCTDPAACNFDASAVQDDGSCIVVVGGTIATADVTTFCVGDGVADIVTATVSGNSGPDYTYIVTDASATTILGGPDDSGTFDFDAAPPGNCLIWGVAYDANDINIPTDQVADITGCFALSNSIEVVRQDCGVDGCTDPNACNYDAAATNDDGSCIVVDGGTIVTADATTFCVGDGIADIVTATSSGTAGPNYTYVVTDASGTTILGGPEDSGTFDFDGAPAGNCLIWGVAYDANNISIPTDQVADITGCFALSNSIEVIREDCGVNGCTDASACNFDPAATNDDGSCTFPGCTDASALNYDADAGCDDGSCITTCYSGPGTIMASSIYVCEGDATIVDADDFLLIPGQSVYYVFHTDGDIDYPDLPVQNAITTGSFLTNGPDVSGVVWVTAFGATSDGAGGPDFNDPCLTISNSIQIFLLDPITITVTDDCDTNSGEFSYTFTVTGGMPDATGSGSYTVTGGYYNGTASPGSPITVGPISDLASYDINVLDDNGCTGMYDQVVECEKLPVELMSFTGEAVTDGNLLKWSTATETENDFYTVEASSDGVNYTRIATVNGAGTTTDISAYSLLDSDVSSGTTYYRLFQTDFDGSVAELGIVAISREGSQFGIYEILPVPAIDNTQITFAGNGADVMFTLHDVNGKVISATTIASNDGISTYEFNVESLVSGVYFISISNDESTDTQKLIVE